MSKKFFLLITVVVMAVLCFAFESSALDATGLCGDNVRWNYDSSTKELVISGNGDMYDYIWNESPFTKSEIRSVDIQYGVTRIGDSAFTLCNNLQNVKISDSVTSIGDCVFVNSAGLTGITIPDSVTSIGEFLFDGCTVTVYCNKNSAIKAYCKDNNIPFVSMDAPDAEVTVSGSVDTISWKLDKRTGVIEFTGNEAMKDYNTYKAPWYEFRYYITSVKLSDGITKIGSNSFNSFYRIEGIDIPDSVTSIGNEAFAYCSRLRSIRISDNVTAIGINAFKNCSSMEEIVLGNSVASIGDGAFDGCMSLKEIHLPSSLKKMGNTFWNCSGLVVYYEGDIYQWMKVEGWEFVSDYFNVVTKPHIHSETVIKGKAPTCTKEGLTDGKLCTACSVVTKPQDKIPAKGHSYKTTTIKATLEESGEQITKCSACDKASKTTTVYYPKTFKLSATSYIYNGKTKKPTVTVKDSKGNIIEDRYYEIKYEKGRKAPGEYTVKITFKGKYEGSKKLCFTIVPKATSKITASQTTTTITLKWNKVTGADGYRIYKYNSKTKKYEKIKDVTKNTLKLSKLKAGTAYKYKVRAYTKDSGTIWGEYSAAFETATRCKTPSISKISSSKKGVASLVWLDVSGESGYQVYYSSKKDSGYKKLDSYKSNVTKCSKKKLKSGKKYYFKVRAYKKTASGTVYSAWSKVKSVKIK